MGWVSHCTAAHLAARQVVEHLAEPSSELRRYWWRRGPGWLLLLLHRVRLLVLRRVLVRLLCILLLRWDAIVLLLWRGLLLGWGHILRGLLHHLLLLLHGWWRGYPALGG